MTKHNHKWKTTRLYSRTSFRQDCKSCGATRRIKTVRPGLDEITYSNGRKALRAEK